MEFCTQIKHRHLAKKRYETYYYIVLIIDVSIGQDFQVIGVSDKLNKVGVFINGHCTLIWSPTFIFTNLLIL
jgi:hypothetical protein